PVKRRACERSLRKPFRVQCVDSCRSLARLKTRLSTIGDRNSNGSCRGCRTVASVRSCCSQRIRGMETAIETVGLYPRDLLEIAVDNSADRQWWAVYTKSRQEKVFCRQLRGHGISHYLPLVEKVSYTRRRRLTSIVPLFSGYVFMHGTVHERLTSLAT